MRFRVPDSVARVARNKWFNLITLSGWSFFLWQAITITMLRHQTSWFWMVIGVFAAISNIVDWNRVIKMFTPNTNQ